MSLRTTVTDFQFQCFAPDHSNVSVTPFCLAEVHCVVLGEYWMVGVPVMDIPGDKMNEKLETFQNYSFSDLNKLAEAGGFSIEATAGAVIAIPPGMIVLTVNPTSWSIGVRYSILARDHYKEVQMSLECMLQTYSYLRESDYFTIKELLDAEHRRERAT